MKRRLSFSALGAVLVAAGWLATRSDDVDRTHTVAFTVERGPVVDTLREIGELAPQDPTLLQAPFTGEIKWLVQDGTWVNQGERVFVFDEEALEQQVSDLRATIVDKRQQLRLAKLQADHARIAEQQRVENAKNDLRLAEIRHRILTTPPVGGRRLLELDAEIKPLEQRLESLQAELEPLEERFRASREVYQTALQAWQEARSRLLELRMGADLAKLNAPTEANAEDKSEGTSDREETDPPLTLEEAQAQAETAEEALDQARSNRNRDRIPYEAAVATIDAIDVEAQERYIQIEIEKRGLPAARLEIDRNVARLRLAESRRQAENGKRALEVGAIAKSRYDQLVADADAAAGRLEILEYRLEIAARPATEDEVATSEAALAAAQRAVDNAQAIFDREMNILSSEMAVTEAEITETTGELDRNGKGFPTAIEGTLTMLRAELDFLTEEDADRHTEIVEEIARLEAELDIAKENPPHIVVAPMDGLVRLRWKDDNGGRFTDIGDRWEKGHTVAMLYPPGNMSVNVGINEVNFQRVREDMPCRVRIPALDMEINDAVVAHFSRIGRDRVETEGQWVTSQHSGIIEFSLSVDLQREVPAFRQGMTVVLEIETRRRDDVLYLPAAAVRQGADGFSVQADPRSDLRTPVEGVFFADDRFLVTGGLAEGDRVFRTYPGGGAT